MKKILLLLALCAGFSSVQGQILQLDSTQLTISIAIDSNKVVAPWDLEWGFDNRLWFSDARRIKAWDPATGVMDTLITIPYGYFCGIAVPKALSGPVYVYAVQDTGYYYASSSFARLVKFSYDQVNDTLTPVDTLVQYVHLSEHSGGKVIIGVDGKIWLTTPEFTFSNDTIGAVVGRTLRMNPDGTAPSGNLRPDLTYSIGHRNAQGMVQLPDGNVFCTEHSGPALRDEVNRITLGGHYGWPAREGYNFCTNMFMDSCNSPTFTAALKQPAYSGILTPAGLDYYDHPAIPEWQNCLIVGTLYQPDTCLAVLKLSSDHDSILNRRSYLKKNIGGINDFKRTRDVCVAPDGSIYCLVRDRSMTNVGTTLVNIGCKIVRIKNDAYVPSSVDAIGLRTMKVYPNPAKDELTIENSRGKQYRITDMTGKVIMRGTLNSDKEVLNVSRLAAGTYFVHVGDWLGVKFSKL